VELTPEQQMRAYVSYLEDMGVRDLYRRDAPAVMLPETLRTRLRVAATGVRANAAPAQTARMTGAPGAVAPRTTSQPPVQPVVARVLASPEGSAAGKPRTDAPVYFGAGEPVEMPPLPPELAAPMPKPKPFDELVPLPAEILPAGARVAALEAVRAEIGDCTRCPLAYAGRHKIVFADGDANARLMFVGEGPGADEDVQGLPFVGKAGQLLNNMITAMGLKREEVYIANIVKCRPPGNRTPEFVEATTCSQFLIKQIDIVRPQVIVALGATAATYLLGVRQSIASLRGKWHSARGAKVAVTFHPAFLLRDPRQKGEAWKDLQRVMAEMGLQAPAKKG
jgi:DNA polymerase